LFLGTMDMSKRVNGLIGYYNLEDWWLTAFTDAERQHIEATFNPLGFGAGTLTQGDIYKTSQTAHRMLRSLAGWFRNTDQDAIIAAKIRSKAAEFEPPQA